MHNQKLIYFFYFYIKHYLDVCFTFNLSIFYRFYDLDSDGFITKQEMTIIMSAIYEMIQKYRINDCINHVERFFQKMDSNKDGIISREEFLTNCKKVSIIIFTCDYF